MPEMGDRANVLGVMIDRLDMQGSLRRIEELISEGGPHQHVVINAAKIVAMREDKKLADIVTSCPLISADGQSIVWASRFLSDPLPERVAGIDLMFALLAMSTQKGYRVFFLGAEEEVVKKVVEICSTQYPGLQISGWHSGYFGEAEEEILIKKIRSSSTDILFVAMSTPKKEYWIAKYLDTLEVSFCMGVGGSFDVLAGKVKRAPYWLQRLGLEWFYRFLQEPRRMWKRYFYTNTAFLWLVLRTYVRQKIQPSHKNTQSM